MSAFATAMAAAQRQIDGLKADLAAMQKERDYWYDRYWKTLDRAHNAEASCSAIAADVTKAANERDAALADLSQARAELDQVGATKGKLGRAVAALQIVRRCITKGADEGPVYCEKRECIEAEARPIIDAILADPESIAAVEAHAELEAVYRAAVRWRRACNIGKNEAAFACALEEEIAKVDARRAGVCKACNGLRVINQRTCPECAAEANARNGEGGE